MNPLAIYVMWHHNFSSGQEYANKIFSDLKRNTNDPLSRGMNIPVFFRSHQNLKKIEPDYKHIVVVALMDDLFEGDSNYVQFIRDIHSSNQPEFHLLPVAFSNRAFKVLPSVNCLRLYEKSSKYDYLISLIAHEAARHLYGLPETRRDDEDPALRLFISHAKADGLAEAKAIKNFVQDELPLDVFFDANSIQVGSEFGRKIESSIKNSVVIVVHTDQYSSREWCRREIMIAKRNNRPIVILNCLKNGESRSFPYMGNVLTVHFLPMDDTVWLRLMAAVMKETLRLKYQSEWIEFVLQKKNDKRNGDIISSYPPELLIVADHIGAQGQRFLYPDPPIGVDEMDELRKLNSTIEYKTATDL